MLPVPLGVGLIAASAFWPQVRDIASGAAINRAALQSTLSALGPEDPLAGAYQIVRVAMQYWMILSTLIGLAPRLVFPTTGQLGTKAKTIWVLLAFFYLLPGFFAFLYPGSTAEGHGAPVDSPFVMACLLFLSGAGGAFLCYINPHLLPWRLAHDLHRTVDADCRKPTAWTA